MLDEPGWAGHCPGQHLDLRLTAEGGYQAQRSHSIASPPEDPRVAIAVELEDGEVSPYLTDGLLGPIGGYFAWRVEAGGPLLPVAGGSGAVPPMAMLRHGAAHRGAVPARPLVAGPLVILEQSRAGHRLLATAAGERAHRQRAGLAPRRPRAPAAGSRLAGATRETVH